MRGGLVRTGATSGAFTFEGREVAFASGESVAEALLASGITAITRSLKYRRLRGPSCLDGDCGSCLARVDGLPNLRTCMVPARAGLRVRAQNQASPALADPTALADRVFARGLDHHHLLVRPRPLNVLMQSVARNLAGLGRLPDAAPRESAQHQYRSPTVLVIGRGPAGSAVVAQLREAGIDVCSVERRPPHPDARPHADDHTAGVFGVYPCVGWVAAAHGGADVLLSYQPRHLVFATGATAGTLVLPHNDLPGILSARGLLRSHARTGLRPQPPFVVVGDGTLADQTHRAFGGTVLQETECESFVGRSAVRAVSLRDGSRVRAATVALAATASPTSDLARQLEAPVHWNGAGFAITRDSVGHVDTQGPWRAWAIGDVAGAANAEADARRVGNNLIGELCRA